MSIGRPAFATAAVVRPGEGGASARLTTSRTPSLAWWLPGSAHGLWAGLRPRVRTRASGALLTFYVDYNSTPQIAINDAAAITGRDYATNPPTKAQTWQRSRSPSDRKWIGYQPSGDFRVLTYGLYATAVDTEAAQQARAQQHRIDTDNRRRAACGTHTPFYAGSPANRLNPHKPANWDPSWFSCDEFPFASTIQGGTPAIIRGVPLSENNQQGSAFSKFVRTGANAVILKQDEGRFNICIINIPEHPNIGNC